MDETESPIKNLGLRLQYQCDIINDIHKEDGLVITARGLGLLRIVANLLHAYDQAGKLIVIVGCDERENESLGQAMAELSSTDDRISKGLRIINNESMSVEKRERLYLEGGVFSVTSRILVVDLLTNILPPERLTGLIVVRAERVVATSMEAWILRIFRRKNPEGFIKAFSESPEPFTTGFAPLANMLKNLFLHNVYLWPRFHVMVSKTLENRKADVVELDVNMTDRMREIQNCLIECTEATLKEIRKLNSKQIDLEDEDWNVDTALYRQFDVLVQRQLDPVWHRVSMKTRQLCRDLTVLRNLLSYLLNYDCVAFLRIIETIIASNSGPNGPKMNQSPWLYMDAAQRIFQLSRERVYLQTGAREASKSSTGLSPVLEVLPKWEMLSDVLTEVETYLGTNPLDESDDSTNAIVVMCGDERTARQLREYLQSSGSDDGSQIATSLMRRKFQDFLVWKESLTKLKNSHLKKTTEPEQGAEEKNSANLRARFVPNKRRRVRGGSTSASTPGRSSLVDEAKALDEMAQSLRPADDDDIKEFKEQDEFDNGDFYLRLLDNDELIAVIPYDGDMDNRVLDEIRPRCVVMYDPYPAFIRRVETYRAEHPLRALRVYFMYYGGSLEEQSYLSVVRKEKDAFTKLIRDKAELALVLTAGPPGAEDPQERFFRTLNTRIAGGGRLKASAEQPRVVVDIREVRSSLPALIDGRGMTVIPCQLIVGDYIISPDICIERKSVKDLIQSLNSGRLYNQCEMMQNHYKTPVLLIEFGQNKSFALEPFVDLTGSINQNDLQTKLVVLTIAFPQLRIIWSSSPEQSAETIEELKKSYDEPDLMKAVGAGVEPGQSNTSTMNEAAVDFLKRLPMVSSKNFRNIVYSDLQTMQEMVNASESDLITLLGPEAGRQLHTFFNIDARE